MHSSLGRRHSSFKKLFDTYLKNSDENKNFSAYAEYEDMVYSLSFSFYLDKNDKSGDDIYIIENITWQEEGLSYHNVCGSNWRTYVSDEIKSIPNFAVYNFTKDILIQDLYLGDKYGDCSDGWFSDRLDSLFKNYPKLSVN